ncbi:MAG: 6-bladed beta-propeller [Gemmatimonadetes bacterium]|nr:6-bladed beta-propeller [Gemmatimonadota bacterium]
MPALPVSDSGHLYVPIDNRTSIAVFDSGGHRIATIGRQGQGPGEFMRIKSLELSSDGDLWVFDNQLGRVTRFDAAHQLMDTHPLDAVQAMGAVQAVGVDSEGSGFVTVRASFGFSGDPSRGRPLDGAAAESDRRLLVEYWRGTTVDDTLAILPTAGSRFHVSVGSGATLVGQQPWSAAPRLGRRADARGIIVATPNDNGNVYLTRFGDRGPHPPTELRAQLPTGRITREAVEDWISAFVGELGKVQVDRGELRKALVIPGQFPGVGRELLGFGEHAWVSLGRAWDQSEWALVDERGHVVGSVRLPYSFRIVAAKDERLWVVTPGPFGAPVITRYRVRLAK